MANFPDHAVPPERMSSFLVRLYLWYAQLNLRQFRFRQYIDHFSVAPAVVPRKNVDVYVLISFLSSEPDWELDSIADQPDFVNRFSIPVDYGYVCEPGTAACKTVLFSILELL